MDISPSTSLSFSRSWFLGRSWLLGAACLALPSFLTAQGALVNFETPHVHPLDMSPDGNTLFAVNTPDNRIEIFELSNNGPLKFVRSVDVGMDPVSVRARTNDEVWVVNHISDTVSVVDLSTGNVVEPWIPTTSLVM